MESTRAVEDRYKGESGRQYHRGVHHDDEAVQQVVARERARRNQPYIMAEDDVFEYGAGTCVNLRELRCHSKTAFDLSDAGKEIAARHGIEFHTDLTELAGRTFDVVLCSHTLEHVPNPLETLGRIRDFIKPGQKLLLSVPYEIDRTYRRYRPGDPNHHLYSWNPLSLGNLVTDAGYKVMTAFVRPFGYEQRLAKLARFGDGVYRGAMWAARRYRPFNECFLVART